MKKLLSAGLALLMLLLCTIPCFAESQSMTISTEGVVAYAFSYPADIEIPWQTEEMNLGEIKAVLLNIEPSKAVRVSVTSANGYNLVSADDATKTIAYDLSGDDNIEYLPGDYGRAYMLSVSVAEEQWQQAVSGRHSDILTFIAEYVDA